MAQGDIDLLVEKVLRVGDGDIAYGSNRNLLLKRPRLDQLYYPKARFSSTYPLGDGDEQRALLIGSET